MPSSLRVTDFAPGRDTVVLDGSVSSPEALQALDSSGNGVLDAPDAAVDVTGGSTYLDLSPVFGAGPGAMVVVLLTTQAGWPYALAIAAGVLSGVVIGAAIELSFVRYMLRRDATEAMRDRSSPSFAARSRPSI